MTHSIYCYSSSGEKLAGLRDDPAILSESNPTVLLLHGFGAEKREGGMFDQLAEGLASAGFVVFRFDFAGRGDSEGDYSTMTLSCLVSQARDLLDFVKAQPGVDADRIGIVGMSFGSTVTAMLAPEDVKAAILLGSVADPYAVISSLFHRGPMDVFDVKGRSRFHFSPEVYIDLDAGFWVDLERHDPVASISRWQMPLCCVHGGADVVAPPDGAQEFYAAANEPKKIVLVDGAGHGFERPHERVAMVAACAEWLKRYLIER